MTKMLYSTSISAAKGLMKMAGSVLFVYILGRSQFVIAMSRMRRRNFQFTGDPDRRARSAAREPVHSSPELSANQSPLFSGWLL